MNDCGSLPALAPNSFPGPRAFAKWFLRDGRFPLTPSEKAIHIFSEYAMESILFRESCWQVELVVLLPGAIVPLHRHNRAVSCDLMVAGTGIVNVGSRLRTYRPQASLLASLVRVDKGVWHGGQPTSGGAVYLSFQQWDDEPSFLSDDWEAQ